MSSVGIEDCGVLIVDDENSILSVLEAFLKQNGMKKIYRANNGAEALSLLAEHGDNIHAVILDLIMPEISGLDVMRHLVNIHCTPVGIIIFTGNTSDETVKEFNDIGTDIVIASNYLSKPMGGPEILEEVERTINLVVKKRDAITMSKNDRLFEKLIDIEQKIDSIEDKQHGFLANIGYDLIRTIIIALAFISMVYFGAGNFLRDLMSK